MADRDPLPLAQLEVRDAVRGGGVHDAGALVHADQLRCVQHDEREPVGQHVGEQRLVRAIDEVRAVHLVEDLVVALEHLEPLLREDVQLVALRDAHVRLPRVHRERDVAGQRPRRRGPCEQEGPAVGVVEAELHVHGGIGRVLAVALAELV